MPHQRWYNSKLRAQRINVWQNMRKFDYKVRYCSRSEFKNHEAWHAWSFARCWFTYTLGKRRKNCWSFKFLYQLPNSRQRRLIWRKIKGSSAFFLHFRHNTSHQDSSAIILTRWTSVDYQKAVGNLVKKKITLDV